MRRALVLLALLPACGLLEEDPADDATATAASTSCRTDGDLPPDDFACTGFSPHARPYAPGATLWSDGAEKARFLDLPEGTAIDANAPEGWRFPVGTKAWKELRVGGRLVETRFMWKVRDDRWVSAAYVWNADGTKATRGEGARIDLGDGRTHAVPTSAECNDCHKGAYDRLLGLEPVSMSLPGAIGFDRLPPKVALPAVDPGLTWLHANCGSCHGRSSTATAYGTGLRLRIGEVEIAARPVETWDLFTTTVGVTARTPDFSGETRVVPGDPAASLIVRLARTRGPGQMPTVGSDVVDEQGVASVEAWIRSLARQSSFGASTERSAPASASAR